MRKKYCNLILGWLLLGLVIDAVLGHTYGNEERNSSHHRRHNHKPKFGPEYQAESLLPLNSTMNATNASVTTIEPILNQTSTHHHNLHHHHHKFVHGFNDDDDSDINNVSVESNDYPIVIHKANMDSQVLISSNGKVKFKSDLKTLIIGAFLFIYGLCIIF